MAIDSTRRGLASWAQSSLAARVPVRWRRRIRTIQVEVDSVRARWDVRRLVEGGAEPDLLVGRGSRRAYLGRVVKRASAQGAADDNLRSVVERLEGVGVDYFLVSVGPGRPGVVGVDKADRQAVLEALDQQAVHRVGYLASVEGTRTGRATRSGAGAAGGVGSAQVVRFFAPTVSPDGLLLTDDQQGCDVEFWSRSGGMLISPRANRYANELGPNDRLPTTREWAGSTYTTYPAFTVDHAFDIAFPIDAVYTWVDGEDPAWLARKNAALGSEGNAGLSTLAANDSRFTSRDELMYSLRSLDRYAEWIRTIYLVTDDQVPAWLDTSNPRIKVVSHREIFGDTGRLPTFNSHAIETRLHRIPGLSEHYLYMNDDVFFGREVSPELFFHGNGMHKFFPSTALFGPGEVVHDDAPVDAAGKNNRDLLFARFGRTVSGKFKHAPHPLRVSIMNKVEQEFHEVVEQTSRSQFRQLDDISIISFSHYYAWFTLDAAPANITYGYVNISAPNAEARLESISARRGLDAFCLNDTDSTLVDPWVQQQLVQAFLESYYPLPSSFENPSES